MKPTIKTLKLARPVLAKETLKDLGVRSGVRTGTGTATVPSRFTDCSTCSIARGGGNAL
jgi:hypothetical protein